LNGLPKDSPVIEKLKTIKEMTDQLGKITKKIMHITKYETKDYIEGSKIIDIDKASSSEIAQGKSTPDGSPDRKRKQG
jgi:hypothetical protein